MPKNKAARVHECDDSRQASQSSSSSPQPASQQRYRPLAPKATLSSSSPTSSNASSGQRDAVKPVNKPRELTFVNMTDPAQSRNQETRKLVRTQVMKIFARERRLRDTLVHSSKSPERPAQASAFPSPQIICECPYPEFRPGRQHSPSPDPICSTCHGSVVATPGLPEGSPPLPSSMAHEPAHSQSMWEMGGSACQTATLTSPSTSLNQIKWPMTLEPYMLELISHALSPSFRACGSLYGLSLFSNRPVASCYPFDVDIDFDGSTSSQGGFESWTPWLALAVSSPALLHATLMLAASHISVLNGSHHENAALVAHHKDRTLVHLHRLLGDCQDTFSDEIIAVAAVLACYELMCHDYVSFQSHVEGIKKLLEVRGGTAGLKPDGIILKVISWTDMMGAYLLSTRPCFSDIIRTPALEFKDPFSPDNWPDMASAQSLVNSQLYHAVNVSLVNHEIFRVICQITSVTTTLHSVPTALSSTFLIATRELLLQRLLSQAPITTDPDSFSPLSECLRLTIMVHSISGLFIPALPPAYYRLVLHGLKNLVTVLEDTGIASTWDEGGYAEILLSVHLIGFQALKLAMAGFLRERERINTPTDGVEDNNIREQREYFTNKARFLMCMLSITSSQEMTESVERAGLGMGRGEDAIGELFMEIKDGV